jgi:hypothetical protein
MSLFASLQALWQSLPPQTRLIVVSATLTVVVRLIRQNAPRLDGRIVHGLVALLSLGGLFLDSLTQGGLANGYLPLLSEFCASATAALTAIGINEVAAKSKSPKSKSSKSKSPKSLPNPGDEGGGSDAT